MTVDPKLVNHLKNEHSMMILLMLICLVGKRHLFFPEVKAVVTKLFFASAFFFE